MYRPSSFESTLHAHHPRRLGDGSVVIQLRGVVEALGEREGEVVREEDGEVEGVFGDFAHVVGCFEEHFVGWGAGLLVGMVAGEGFFEVEFGAERDGVGVCGFGVGFGVGVGGGFLVCCF